MNIAFLGYLPPLQIGGGGLCNHEILKGMVTRGWSVTAIVPLPVGDPPAAYQSAAPGVRFVTFPTDAFEADALVPRNDNYRNQRRHVLARLKRLVANDRPDAIFVGRSSFALDVPAFARRHAIPTLIIHHGSIYRMLAGHYPPSLTEEYLEDFRAMDVAIVPSHHSAARLRQAGFRGVRTIWNGIDVDRFRPGRGDKAVLERLAIPPGRFVVSHVSNMKAVKRVEDLVAAAKIAVEQEPRLLFLIVGGGPSLAGVKSAVDNAGISEHFRFTGMIPYAEVPDYIGISDTVAMPSEIESLSRVYLETMASAKVLVASDILASREVVQEGVSGLLFPRGDAATLAAVLVSAARDPEMCGRIGAAARAHVVEHHRVEDMIDRYLATFEELVAAGKADCRSAARVS
ncbi:MAG: glycosyltransferase family 4 protein [Alphaproteobacteria bacterium]|nr:glycosyltransferase family 4 protein [Alphaproteobacteria bacterium]